MDVQAGRARLGKLAAFKIPLTGNQLVSRITFIWFQLTEITVFLDLM